MNDEKRVVALGEEVKERNRLRVGVRRKRKKVTADKARKKLGNARRNRQRL